MRIRLTILLASGWFTLGVASAELPALAKKFYADDPIWTAPPPVPVVDARRRKLDDYYDFLENTFRPQGERARKGAALPAHSINTVDEVPDSAWYTNRHAKRAMSLAELRAGPGDTRAPADGTWTVVAAKSEGVTPGFRIRDTAGREYLLKFDPLSNPEMASAADVLTSRIFHAIGYNVPENYIVHFDRRRISIGEGAQLKDARGQRRAIRESDIDEMLTKAPRRPDGTYRAMASMVIDGKPIGPFQYHGTRGDDPNDLVEHEHRRELRALRTICAWVGHDDSRAINTLDVLTSEGGVPFVKHYLIDFGASLGSASYMPNSPRDGNVAMFDWRSSAAQFFTLGLYAPKWQRARFPDLPSTGRFEYEVFDPVRWVPGYPNSAFHNEGPADRIWAARKIAAFTESEIRAIVGTGQYTDPAATDWVARCLIERRRKIINAFLPGMSGLDGFAVKESRLSWSYLGPGDAPSQVAVQWSQFDNGSGARRALHGETSARIPSGQDATGYLVADLSGSSGPRISVYVRTRPEGPMVVGVERRTGDATGKEK
jgi:hypothetical protein